MTRLDPGKLSAADRAVAGAGVLALIALFLPWYGASGLGFSASVSGWSTSYGWLGGLLIVAAAVLLVVHRAAMDTSWMRLTPAVLVLGISLLGTLIVVIRWLTMPSAGGIGGTLDYGPRIGIFLAIAAGVVQVVVALRQFRSSGEALPWKKGGATVP